IGTTDNVNFKIRTKNNVRMTITAGGNVGIGTSAPASKLDVKGIITGFDSYFGKNYPISAGTSGASYSSVGYGLTFTDTTANYRYRINGDFSSMLSFRSGGFDFNTAPFGTVGSVIPYSTAMVILQNGNVGIGISAPSTKLYVKGIPSSPAAPVVLIENPGNSSFSHGVFINAGSNTASGATFVLFGRPDGTNIGSIRQNSATAVGYFTTSDKRLKNIIGTSQRGLSDLMKINIYDYTFKTDPQKQVLTGFMAQELYDVFPQSVSKPRENNEPAEKNPWMVDYGSVTPLIIRSVQEQQQIINDLQKQNAEMKSRLDKFENALELQTQKSKTISSEINNEFQIIPNPATGSISIHFENASSKGMQLIIFDAQGKTVKSVPVNGSETQISISEFANGNYFVQLLEGNILLRVQKMTVNK
ncbi:MAG: T9SS type A sorting domain-containing protein, partial [Bacteroidia bacterium]